MSAAQAYVGMSSAFAPVLPHLSIMEPLYVDDVAIRMAAHDVPPEVFHEMQRLLGEPGALERATSDRHLQASFHLAHQQTWFVMDGIPDCAQTTSGSQAGDPLGESSSSRATRGPPTGSGSTWWPGAGSCESPYGQCALPGLHTEGCVRRNMYPAGPTWMIRYIFWAINPRRS